MEIVFSRHAKRRLKLYGISELTIREILAEPDFAEGNHEITCVVTGVKHPIKAVFSLERDILTVITAYPLKKGFANESVL